MLLSYALIWFKHLDYLTAELEDLNDSYKSSSLGFFDPTNFDENINFWKETHEENPDDLIEIKEQNAKFIKDMWLWLNGAPANLRYGDGVSNSALQENFDPMGDASGTVTPKESQVIAEYALDYEPTAFEGQYYLRSSTGVYQPSADKTKWYIKCLTNTNECV